MRFLDAEFVQGFIRMANDGWEQDHTVYGKTVFTEHNTMFGKTTITILFRVKHLPILNSKDISTASPG